jgi:hypothetical protein
MAVSKAVSNATQTSTSFICHHRVLLYSCTCFNNYTYVPEPTITSSWRIRYSSLDQVFSIFKFVVSLQLL